MIDVNPDFCSMANAIVNSGMNKVDLAERLGCSRPVLYKILDGENTDPKFSVGAGIIQLFEYRVNGDK